MTTSYDETPYISRSNPKTRPAHLYMIGSLFGMTPPDFNKCRVLEIGCADGGNIVPLAFNYPDSHFVGIDLSEEQINNGLEFVKELDIPNIRLLAMDIKNYDNVEKFDYIICHGVISWADHETRGFLFRFIKQQLAEDGIAYMSYNTLPGWNMLRSLREMMIYETKNISSPKQKAAQARGLLNFLQKNADSCPQSYKALLSEELQSLSNKPDYYLLHEHLEADNHAYYFHEIFEEFSAQGLGYLGDAQLDKMFIGKFSENAREELSQIKDIIRQEQYIDYLTNRRFRATLLCHDDVILNRNITAKSFKKFYLGSLATPVTNDGDQTQAVKAFRIPGSDKTIIPQKPLGEAILNELFSARNCPIIYKELSSRIRRIIPEVPEKEIEDVVPKWLTTLLVSGSLAIQADSPAFSNLINDKPAAYSLALAQAKRKNHVTNLRHETVCLNKFARSLLLILDGSRDRTEILRKMQGYIDQGVLNISLQHAEGRKRLNESDLETLIERQLQRFADVALLSIEINRHVETS